MKISQDPNNTHWSRTTDRFGHKILSSLGWAPGTVLGADPSSPLHTSASSSHIKVVLKDDNLGIGCSKRQAADECTGLGDLQSLLGRLNGKSQDAVKEEEDVRKTLYVQGKYGMKFVRGGVYVSSDLTELVKKIGGVGGIGPVIKKEEEESDVDELLKPSKKRKREENEEEDKKETKEQRRQRRQEKKDRKEQRAKDKQLRKEARRLAKSDGSTNSSTTKASSSKSSSKKDKKIKKEKRQESKHSSTSSSSSSSDDDEVTTSASPSTSVSTPVLTSGTSTPVHATGRHALRSKWIAQKRASVMDAKALNEVRVMSLPHIIRMIRQYANFTCENSDFDDQGLISCVRDCSIRCDIPKGFSVVVDCLVRYRVMVKTVDASAYTAHFLFLFVFIQK